MKTTIYYFFILLFITLFNSNYAQDYKELLKGPVIDLSQCNFVISEIKTVKKIDTGKEKIKCDEWGYKLLELKITGKAPIDGVLIYNQAIFSFLYKNGEESGISLSKAVGQRFTLKSGKKEQLWATWQGKARGTNVTTVITKLIKLNYIWQLKSLKK